MLKKKELDNFKSMSKPNTSSFIFGELPQQTYSFTPLKDGQKVYKLKK